MIPSFTRQSEDCRFEVSYIIINRLYKKHIMLYILILKTLLYKVATSFPSFIIEKWVGNNI